jgi:Ran GTPase-activating protein (RanGAP) involved in mRNA processing and transport
MKEEKIMFQSKSYSHWFTEVIRQLRHNDPMLEQLTLDTYCLGEATQDDMRLLCDVLQTNHTLKSFVLKNISLKEEVVSALTGALCQHPTLEALTLQNNSISTKSLSAFFELLKVNPNIVRFHFEITQGREGSLDEASTHLLSDVLKHHQTLQSLFLDDRQMSTYSVITLNEALKINRSIETLHFVVRMNTETRHTLFDVLKYNNTVKDLSIQWDPDGSFPDLNLADNLAANHTLEKLTILDSHFSFALACALGSGLAENRMLKSLNLVHCANLQDDAGEVLARALQRNDILQELRIEISSFGDRTMKAFSDMLKENTTLEKLFMIHHPESTKIAHFFGEALQLNKTLRVLELSDNDFDKVGVRILSKALKYNQTLQELILNSTVIGDAGVILLSDVLKENSDLRVLSLERCRMGDAGAIALGEMLSENQALQVLRLDHNQIAESGIRSLSCALKFNLALQVLTLNHNRIDDTGMCLLTEALTYNHMLGVLELNSNRIGNCGVSALLDLLNDNQTLEIVRLDHNSIDRRRIEED